MRFTKFDIGAEIIAILTRGMYPDPKDALREYIQNGVDAKATHIAVKIRQSNIIVHDNGFGMDYDTLRRAARVGVSDKNPSKDVGFMGIGIYSAYHLCESLTITSKEQDCSPNRLVMDFSGMKRVLTEQRKLRQQGEIDSDKLIDLQTLLEDYVKITDNGSLNDDDFPNIGTRVELKGISEYFYVEISDFDKTSRYLQDVVPLKFNETLFSFATNVQEAISVACEKNQSYFELIDLTLQVNSESKNLYRPYSDADFSNKPIDANIQELKDRDGTFYGVAWGCLNSERKKIKNNNLRGFLIKKQGFAIGKRSDVVKIFPRGNTFFDRYIGEIIITNPSLLPNAARNDIEYSPLRERFYAVLTDVASKYDDFANAYQEDCKADEVLDDLINNTKQINIQVNMSLQNSDELLYRYTNLSKHEKTLSDRIQAKRIRQSRMEEAKTLEKEIKRLLDFIKERLTINNNAKKAFSETGNKATNGNGKEVLSISKKLNSLSVSNTNQTPIRYESLIELVDDLEFKYDENVKLILEIIDERYVQATSKNKDDYYSHLQNIRQEFFEEE
jgi:hypothetical protein